MDYEYEQHIKRGSTVPEGRSGDVVEGVVETFTKILSLGIADIFDISADAESRGSSRQPSPVRAQSPKPALNKPAAANAKSKKGGLGAVKIMKQPANADSINAAAATQAAQPSTSAGATQAPAAQPEAAANRAEPAVRQAQSAAEQQRQARAKAGLLDALVTGVSSFGQKATSLLNTLDANFDQMFNPMAELAAEEHARKLAEQQAAAAAQPHQPGSARAAKLAGSSASAQQAGSRQGGALDDEVTSKATSTSCATHPVSGGSLVLRSPRKSSQGDAGAPAQAPTSPAAAAATTSPRPMQGSTTPQSRGSNQRQARASPQAAARPSPQQQQDDSVLGAMMRAVGATQPAPGAAASVSIDVQGSPAQRRSTGAASALLRSPAGAAAIQAELARLKAEYTRVVADLERASRTCDELVAENSKLRGGCLDGVSVLDPALNETVRTQLEALLAEKARLAAENSRLQHENSGLQQLLAYTREHSEVGAEDCDEAALGAAGFPAQGATSSLQGISSSRFRDHASAGGAGDDEVAAVDEYYTSLLASASKGLEPPPELGLGVAGGEARRCGSPPPPFPALSPAHAGEAGGEDRGAWGSGGGMSPCALLQRAHTAELEQQQEEGGAQQEQQQQGGDSAGAEQEGSSTGSEGVVAAAVAEVVQQQQAASAAAAGKGKKGGKASKKAAASAAKVARALAAAAIPACSSPPDVAGGYDAHVVVHSLGSSQAEAPSPTRSAPDCSAVQDVGCA